MGLIIAVGNGACNIAAAIQAQRIENARFVFLDTEPDDLGNHPGVGETILLQGTETEQQEAISRLFASDVKNVFILACLGGRTGSHFAPLAAHLAKAAGKAPACIVTLPFHFEGEKQMATANEALGELKECTPDVLVFDNEKLKTQYPDLSLLDAFRKADAQVAEALRKRLI